MATLFDLSRFELKPGRGLVPSSEERFSPFSESSSSLGLAEGGAEPPPDQSTGSSIFRRIVQGIDKLGETIQSGGAAIAREEDPIFKRRAQEEELAIRRFQAIAGATKFFDELSFLQEENPQMADRLSQAASKSLSQLLGSEIPAQEVKKYLADPSRRESLSAQYPFAQATLGPRAFRKALREGNIKPLEDTDLRLGREVATQIFQKLHDSGNLSTDTNEALKQLDSVSESQGVRLSRYLKDDDPIFERFGIKSPKTIQELAQTQGKAQIGTPTDLGFASLITGRTITKLADLTQDEQQEVLFYKDVPQEVKAQILSLLNKSKQEGKRASVVEVFDEALKKAKLPEQQRLELAERRADISERLAVATEKRLDLLEKRQVRIPDPDRRQIAGIDTGVQQLEDLDRLFRKTEAFKTGNVTGILRVAIATNRKVRFLDEIEALPLGRLTGPEKEFAATYNALLIRLRQLSGDPRFSDKDALLTLQGLGDGLLGRQFSLQVNAAKRFLQRERLNLMKGLQAAGFDVEKLEPEQKRPSILSIERK